uniref:Uncharacterized protein n=1 Tax=Seriola lalandi dorsalis TaxID=1841481 RepID=A0A3B4Y1Y7_SERLL
LSTQHAAAAAVLIVCMAAPVVVRRSGPALCPSFAEVCSFLDRYGAALDLPEMTFPQMERYLRDTTTGEGSIEVVVLVVLGRRSGGKLRHLKPKEKGPPLPPSPSSS